MEKQLENEMGTATIGSVFQGLYTLPPYFLGFTGFVSGLCRLHVRLMIVLLLVFSRALKSKCKGTWTKKWTP